jgi:hypothetical protein
MAILFSQDMLLSAFYCDGAMQGTAFRLLATNAGERCGLVKYFVSAITQAVFNYGAFFPLSVGGAACATGNGTDAGPGNRRIATAHYRTNQTSDKRTLGSTFSSLLFDLGCDLLAFTDIGLILRHVDPGRVDDRF